jgi:cation diffusion facilitator CzcD-associated flavoprotein CzcO
MGAEVPSIVSMLPEDEWRLNGPLHQERQLKIICIGAGASGLLFAYKVQRNFDKVDMILYEKNEALGGTWLENR